jgi:hypothetical protein
MTITNQLRIEQRRAPGIPGQGRRRMRRAHDPARLCGRGGRRGAKAQQQRGDPGGLRGKRQLAAGDEVELARIAKDFQHDGAQRIAGERVRCAAQCCFDIGSAYGDQTARIEAKLVKTARRQRAGFHFRKILPHPDQRFARRNSCRDARDKTGCRRALMAPGKHFMHGGGRKPAAQPRIGRLVAERDLVEPAHIAMGFDAFDAAAQGRKRVCACSA